MNKFLDERRPPGGAFLRGSAQPVGRFRDANAQSIEMAGNK